MVEMKIRLGVSVALLIAYRVGGAALLQPQHVDNSRSLEGVVKWR